MSDSSSGSDTLLKEGPDVGCSSDESSVSVTQTFYTAAIEPGQLKKFQAKQFAFQHIPMEMINAEENTGSSGSAPELPTEESISNSITFVTTREHLSRLPGKPQVVQFKEPSQGHIPVGAKSHIPEGAESHIPEGAESHTPEATDKEALLAITAAAAEERNSNDGSVKRKTVTREERRRKRKKGEKATEKKKTRISKTKSKEVLQRQNSIGMKKPGCCDFLCCMCLKNSLLYSMEFILNLVFVISEFIEGNYVLGGSALFFMLASTITAQVFAARVHLHIFPLPANKCNIFKKLAIFFKMNPFIQILWAYRYNRKNQGLRHYLYYRLALTHYISHMMETFVFLILRLSHSTHYNILSYKSLIILSPSILNAFCTIIATLDWEKCKRSKSQTSYDTMLTVRKCGLTVNIQTVVKFIIYLLMVFGRCITMFILLHAVDWATSELPYLVYACHVVLLAFNFLTLCLSNSKLSVENFFKTLFLAFNETFFNQFDCFIKVPFKIHFIPAYLINIASIITIVILHEAFHQEDVKHANSHFAVSIMGYCAIALYLFAGIFVVLYKKFICPDVLKSQEMWKFDKSVLTEV